MAFGDVREIRHAISKATENAVTFGDDSVDISVTRRPHLRGHRSSNADYQSRRACLATQLRLLVRSGTSRRASPPVGNYGMHKTHSRQHFLTAEFFWIDGRSSKRCAIIYLRDGSSPQRRVIKISCRFDANDPHPGTAKKESEQRLAAGLNTKVSADHGICERMPADFP